MTKARVAAEELVRGAASGCAAALEAELRALDRQGCGSVRSKDFEAAVQRSGLGIPADKVSEEASEGLGSGNIIQLNLLYFCLCSPDEGPFCGSGRGGGVWDGSIS